MSLDKHELRYLITELKKVFTDKNELIKVLNDIMDVRTEVSHVSDEVVDIKSFIEKKNVDTLAEMKSYTDVPLGFVTYCKEDGKRYEYLDYEVEDDITGKWREFKVGLDIDEELLTKECSYVGDIEPEDEDTIWFYTGESNYSQISYDNPVVDELFSCIQSLKQQVEVLQADVEYLKLNGGGSIPDRPNDDEDDNEKVESAILLEDGTSFLLEDGGFLLLESAINTIKDSILLLENGTALLLEDGSHIKLEK